MEIKTDKIIKSNHEDYIEFEQSQFIVGLIVGEKLEIFIDGIKIKEYIAKYIDCHFNMTIQDKGVKREPTEIEKIDSQIAELQRQKTEEEAKENKK